MVNIMVGLIVTSLKFLIKFLGINFDCQKTESPAYTFVAHMAPLGLAFYQKGALPKTI
ncbi:MAG: hypothetical protein CM1200mP16_03630 [Nitrospina sp.]|nr:MAG: hypothetical protein CM1200mP16_03630 [Nitrospina sp.]